VEEFEVAIPGGIWVAIGALTTQLTRQSNLLKPTQDEIKTAIDRYEMNQKRVDFEYEKQVNLLQQRQRSH
jgi:hypothetical protein